MVLTSYQAGSLLPQFTQVTEYVHLNTDGSQERSELKLLLYLRAMVDEVNVGIKHDINPRPSSTIMTVDDRRSSHD